MNSLAIFGIAAATIFGLATALAGNVQAAENVIYAGNGDLAAAQPIPERADIAGAQVVSGRRALEPEQAIFWSVETPWLKQ